MHCNNYQEMRPVVQAECTLKESAAINQILGRRVSVILIDKYLFETLGLQRRCRVHKDYMITPYIMDNWFIF